MPPIASHPPSRRAPRGLHALRLAALTACLSPGWAAATDPGALPEGGRVVVGKASLASEGRTLTVSQASSRAILEWQRFDIGSAATVQFQQPSSSSVALNRVVGGTPSRIFGRLSANGHVYLVNGAGVLFGRGAQVDVGGLVTSTLDVADGDFLAGRERFEPGTELTALGLAPGTDRQADAASDAQAAAAIGQAAEPDDRAATESGAPRQLTMDAGADGHLRYGLASDEVQALLDDGGLVDDGDGLVLTARGASALASAVVAHDGAPQARVATRRDGRLLLLASDEADGARTDQRTRAPRTALHAGSDARPLLPD